MYNVHEYTRGHAPPASRRITGFIKNRIRESRDFSTHARGRKTGFWKSSPRDHIIYIVNIIIGTRGVWRNGSLSGRRCADGLEHMCSNYSLRPLQEQVISFVQGSDVFVGLPTGSGKSLCYNILPDVFN